MRISLTRQLKVNLGNYESYSFGATVTMEHGDLGYTDEEWTDQIAKDDTSLERGTTLMQNLAEEWVDRLIVEDVKAAQGITEEDRSVVLRAFVKTPAPTPARSTHARTARRPSSR